jgi:hypothetical protein
MKYYGDKNNNPATQVKVLTDACLDSYYFWKNTAGASLILFFQNNY